jgi:hypothetical protein
MGKRRVMARSYVRAPDAASGARPRTAPRASAAQTVNPATSTVIARPNVTHELGVPLALGLRSLSLLGDVHEHEHPGQAGESDRVEGPFPRTMLDQASQDHNLHDVVDGIATADTRGDAAMRWWPRERCDRTARGYARPRSPRLP